MKATVLVVIVVRSTGREKDTVTGVLRGTLISPIVGVVNQILHRRRGRHHIPNENTGIGRGERGIGEIRAGQRDTDRFTRVARICREGRDRRRANHARASGDGQKIANGVVGRAATFQWSSITCERRPRSS